jgi:DNA-binding winged helix-turn-helix (wHTH) protein
MEGGDDELRFGPFWLSRQRREVRAEAGPVPMGARAFDVLVTLLDRAGRLVTKNELLDLVWPGQAVEENNLHVQIAALRRALSPHQALVQTVPGRGYRYIGEVTGQPDTPPPPVVPEATSNLPAPIGRLIGRESELRELQGLLAANRLVTITGASGIGKTRLVLALGHAVAKQFPAGVWLINLAPLATPDLVQAAVITALGLRVGETGRLFEAIAATFKQPALLLFDNCEHQLDPVSTLVVGLLRNCPAISVVTTSQEPLRVESEMVYRLDPLALPPRGAKEVGGFGAVALFIRRAESADRRFKFSPETSAMVVEICRALDGIPLALEMAAARVPALGLAGLKTRLDERLRLFTAGARTAEARHRTLRDMVAWRATTCWSRLTRRCSVGWGCLPAASPPPQQRR